METELVITFPDNLGLEARYKDFVVRLGDFDGWFEGSAPGAFDLFIVSLGLCTAANVFAFMRARDFDMACAKIVMKGTYDEDDGLIERFTFDVFLPESLPGKYHRAVERAVDACAVKKHMIKTPEFVTRIILCDGNE